MSDSWQLILSRQAAKYIKQMGPQSAMRVLATLIRLAADPYSASPKRLEGRPEFSLRVGNLRVLYRLNERRKVIGVVGILPRGQAYRSK